MKLATEPYLSQITHWPQTGRHILAQYDEDSVVVYQAYTSSIGHFAASFGYFGGEFNLNRMSWIKPNFLWMMYRCGWGTKENQEVVLAVWLKRFAFDTILAQAVHSAYVPGVFVNEAAWKEAVAASDVRLQWDPDHDPAGKPLERRAVQLGLRGNVLASYAHEWILNIEDVSEFVGEQRQYVQTSDYTDLLTPSEHVYEVTDTEVVARLGLS